MRVISKLRKDLILQVGTGALWISDMDVRPQTWGPFKSSKMNYIWMHK
jgi:hypothetical protein